VNKISPLTSLNAYQNSFSVGSPQRRADNQQAFNYDGLNPLRGLSFGGQNPAVSINPAQRTQTQNPQITSYINNLSQIDRQDIALNGNYNNMFVSHNGKDGVAAQKLNILA